MGPDLAKRIRFYSLGYLNIFLFWILNLGLATISQSIQYIMWLYDNSEYLGHTVPLWNLYHKYKQWRPAYLHKTSSSHKFPTFSLNI